MKKIAVLVASVIAMLGFALAPLVTPAYAAVDCTSVPSSQQAGCAACSVEDDANTWDSSGNGECTRPNSSGDLNSIIHTIINVMLFIVGILAVIMIVWGGIRYTSSAGNKQSLDSAKNTIIYAVVGLVVAIIAFALVQWIFNSLQA